VLARIDRLNPVLNAFCVVDPESALARRRRARRDGARPPAGDLDGVPVSIKDLILAKGWPTLRGSRTVDPKQAWDVDAPATGAAARSRRRDPRQDDDTRVRLQGRDQLAAHRHHPQPVESGEDAGRARRAAPPRRWPRAWGRSRSAPTAPGSVRIPAGFCGNFGLKPSFGRVPAYPLSPMGSVAHLGPHTMSVADAALMMNVLKRPDARDWTSLPYDDRDYLRGLDDGVKGLRIAFSPALGYAKNVHPEVAAAVAAAVRALEGLGANVEAVDPGIADPLEISTGLWFAGVAAIWSGLTPAQQAVADPDFRAQAELGARYSALDLHKLAMRRIDLGSHLRQFMTRYDLIATPTLAVPAFDARPAGHTPMNAESMLAWTPFSYPFNLSQQPACTIPCGLTRDGLPIGLQLVGPMFGDAVVLRAARAYETLRPIPRPPLAQAG
jgi:aspartyl-tRNA(Asn)/glutamyl-tRNA(Gln) amidotransferase subunit A